MSPLSFVLFDSTKSVWAAYWNLFQKIDKVAVKECQLICFLYFSFSYYYTLYFSSMLFIFIDHVLKYYTVNIILECLYKA